MAAKHKPARKLDESNGATLTVRLLADDWTRLRELRALKTTDVTTPSDAEIVRWALREAHEKHCGGKLL